VRELSDKEVGPRLGSIDPGRRPFIFAWSKQGGELMKGRSKEAVLRKIRPTANHLPGSTPSYALDRILDEAS
jgi:RNA ligase